jgi:hypothetical protein
MAAVDLRKLTAPDFEPRIDDLFRVELPELDLSLKLAEVRELGRGKRDGGAFSLLFVSPAGPFLPQAMYPLAHATLGTLRIFLVPLGPMHGGNGYEAIFT